MRVLSQPNTVDGEARKAEFESIKTSKDAARFMAKAKLKIRFGQEAD